MQETIQPNVTHQTTFPTPVFDFTATINAALAQAVMQANAPVLARIAVLEEKVAALEARIDGATLTPLTHEYIAKVARESVAEVSDERIKEIAEAAAEAAIYEHNDAYDHDEYDRLEDKIDDKVSEAFDDHDMDDKIREAIGGLTFSLRVA